VGDNLKTVIVAGEDGTPVEVSSLGGLQVVPADHVEATTLIAVANRTTSGTDIALVAAPGSGNRIVLVGIVATISAEANVLVHWGSGTSLPVLQFNYLAGSGVAYHWGPYGPKGGDNAALTFDLGTTVNLQLTVYYYTEAI
jgi:hypothetical protein